MAIRVDGFLVHRDISIVDFVLLVKKDNNDTLRP